jgi:2'-deoxynucleoside 5'-phosphate N-hydrolase
MIVYCAAPIKGDQKFHNYCLDIIKQVTSLGHTALSELNDEFKPAVPLTEKEIFSRDTKWIDKSDIVIAEVSGPSLGVGFEIAYSLYKKKMHVLALVSSESNNVSAMITGCHSELLKVKKYSDTEDLKKAVSTFIKNFAPSNNN